MSLPILTTSARKSLKRCPQQWVWRYEDGLVPRGDDGTADALWFGIGVHLALAEWYKKGKRRGQHPADTFEDWASDEIRYVKANREDWDDVPKYEDALELGIAMLEQYIDKWGQDEQWNIIHIEHPFKVRITRKGTPLAIFQSTFDGVERDEVDGGIYLLEHKTATTISLAYLELDDQAGAYWAVASDVLRSEGILKEREKIKGIQYNFLRKAMPDERPQNADGLYLNLNGTVSKKQPRPYFVRPEPIMRSVGERFAQMERIADEAAVMEGIRSGAIPVLKNTTWECPRCEFFTMCTLHERGSNSWQELKRDSYDVVDPYARYTVKSAGE